MEGGAPATLMTTAGSQELAPPCIYEMDSGWLLSFNQMPSWKSLTSSSSTSGRAKGGTKVTFDTIKAGIPVGFLSAGCPGSLRSSRCRIVFDAPAARKHAFTMSAQEIIAELPKLKPDELRLVKAKVDDLAKAQRRTIGDALLEVAGTAEGLPTAPAFLRRMLERAKPRDWPADYALNHGN